MVEKYLFPVLFVVTLSCNKSGTGGGTTPPPSPPPITNDSTFANPLLSSGPDPWVIQKDSFYYYTHTGGDKIQVRRTTAMSKLDYAETKIIWLKPATGPNSHNIWAPELHYLDNKWYAYYTAGATPDLGTQRMFVLENTSPDPFAGTWVEKGKMADPAADYFAIDATALQHNGKTYLIWSGHASATDNIQRLYIAELSNPYTLATARVLISSPQYDWEMGGAPPAVNEGPVVLKNAAGRVFLIYSASGCWTDDYKLGMLTLKEGGDPIQAADWVKSAQPVFVKKPESNAFGPGHNSFFKSPDGTEDWILYHANRFSGEGCADKRAPRIQKFGWNSDGTPNFGEPVSINIKITKPSGEKE